MANEKAPETSTHYCLRNVLHNGKRYTVGAPIELTAGQAKQLLAGPSPAVSKTDPAAAAKALAEADEAKAAADTAKGKK